MLNDCIEGDIIFSSNFITTAADTDPTSPAPRRDDNFSNNVGNMYKVVKIGVAPTSASTYLVEDPSTSSSTR